MLVSCSKQEEETSPSKGRIRLSFFHLVDGVPVEKDTMKYINAAGNHYEVDQLMYFISDLTLHKADGTKILVDDWKDIHYVDIEIPETLSWDVYDSIPAGAYDSVTFVFGIPPEKNIPFLFVNPPEVNMAWPDVLGGGFHYMMLNGKWIDTSGMVNNFDLHLGIGQLYRSDVIVIDSIYAFVHNHFTVSLPGSAFTIANGSVTELGINMNIESWFITPHIFDLDYWGGYIMQNQPAMHSVKENGQDVFTLAWIHNK